MVDRDLLTAKLLELHDRTLRVRSKCPATADELRADRDALDLVSFNLMLAVQSCSGVIAAGTAASLCRAVGLRNVVAHGYAGVNPAMVHAAARTGVADLDAFAREVTQWIVRREGGG